MFRFVIVIAALLAVHRAAAQDAVVLASTVPGYLPGMIVTSADRLNVPEGASATLLFQSGEILRLGGPFDGTLGKQHTAPGTSPVAVLADIFRMRGMDVSVIGGTRAIVSRRPVAAIENVQVDPQHSGTYCVEDSSSIWIARPTGDQRAYAVRRKGSSRAVEWPSDAIRIEWPTDVQIEDGDQFELAADGQSRVTATFRTMPSDGTTDASKVAIGMLMGCHDQFDRELKRISQSVSMPELWLTTDRGRHPTYRQGEPINLTVTANTDGYLYCVAGAPGGSAVPIFPAGAIDGAQLRSSVAVSIPGRRQPVQLIAGPTLQVVRCWLADRDITPELPQALTGAASRRLPDQFSDDLDKLFAHISGTRIESDSLSIRTE